MTPIYRNTRTSLPITSSEDKYFYLTNSEYYPHSNIIYIRFEDNNFSLDQYSIKYCLTNIDPSSYPNRAVSECLFSLKDYYFKEISSGTTKYYCKISTSSSYYYSIIYYRGKGGSWSDGNLYVTTDYNDLVPTFVMTEVSRNVRRFLTTINLQDKYFYLTNSEYYPYSNNIYICLEDNNFGLKYNNIKYCLTNTNPSSYPDIAIKNCSFTSISYYSKESSSSAINYYYNIFITNSYAYSIVYYDGILPSGLLYVTTDYNDLAKTVKIIQVSINSKTSLPTNSSYYKYFSLTNSNYSNHSNYIYICLEDNNFGLRYNNIKYCFTDTNPSSYPDIAIEDCSFSSISYYNTQNSSGTIKYYYKISNISSYAYSIVNYEGNNSFGYLYVTTDYNELVPTFIMTKVSRNDRRLLSTINLQDKYFYLTNSEYYPYSNNIYICLEDINFDLRYNNIKYCFTDTNPSSYPDIAIKNCSFISISYYNTQSSSNAIKYYYNISNTNSYAYSIVYYDGNNSSGNLYATSDYNDLAKTVNIIQVSINSKTSLPTNTLYYKYFSLTNSNYYSYSNYIYICLEDNNFGLRYNNIKYCSTNTNPSIYPDNAIKDCSFSSISYYNTQNSSGTIKYYYKISNISSYAYSIVNYEGNNSFGYLYVTTDYNNLVPTKKMTKININSRTSLPTISSEDKYFYLTNSNYSNYSNYIYICLEDNNFGLKYNNIKYCLTNTNPSSYPDIAIKNCSFTSISYYNTQSSSSAIKYYYNISNTNSYTYSIVYYDGNNSSGNLYVTSDYKSISIDDNNDNNKGNKGLSTGVIIGIVAGSIVVLVAVIIIIYFFCPCCRKNKIDIIPDPNANEPENLLPNDNPDIQK